MVRIRLDGSIGLVIDVVYGLPQGSLISLILFMLYIAPLFWLRSPYTRFGYADDVALLWTSIDLDGNYNLLMANL
jgi:hypothetical protein